MTYLLKRIILFIENRQINSWIFFLLFIYIVLIIKFITIQEIDNNIFFGIYSVAVSVYILSRFAIAYFYEPEFTKVDEKYQPTVSFALPTKNEEQNIKKTILKIAQINYPKNKFDIIAVNDGSTDNSLLRMREAKMIAARNGIKVKVIDWKINKGKREGMAECIKKSKSEIIIFIDSDSFVETDVAKSIVKYFIDPTVAAVAGHGYVANADVNLLTKMQDVRYFVAFKAYKGVEALFGAVTCCSGCCSAYRRKYVLEVLIDWLQQTFLGIRCTYGDDRSLTNFLLRKGYKTLFAPEAKAYTIVPDTFKRFMSQQLRWKKSWLRESFKASFFMWKKNPIMAISFYMGIILPLIAPVVVVRALLWYPYATGKAPWFYLFGLFLMAMIYGLYYFIHTKDKKWIYGVFFATFYTLVLIWQLPWAILNLRDPKWGTR